MNALVLEEYGKFVYKAVPDPVLRDENDLLVRVRAPAICGSDVRPLVSAVAPLAEGAAWFDRLARREGGLLKVVLEP